MQEENKQQGSVKYATWKFTLLELLGLLALIGLLVTIGLKYFFG